MQELKLLESASRKRVLFAGERIVDVYRYVQPLGRPTKDAIISVEQIDEERFTGGVFAAATHARGFVSAIDLVEGGTLYTKTRFIERSHLRKLFQLYEHSGELDYILPALNTYDCIVLLDYGHGMFTSGNIDAWREAPYLAVNVQTNSGNYGYNLATKYPRVDYLCVDEDEARLATQNHRGPIEQSLMQLTSRADKVVITMGRAGAIGWSMASDIVACPAFSTVVVDTMGAGDAFFAVSALVAAEADMLSLLRIGNAAGAIHAGIVGHRKGVTKDDLCTLLAAVPRPAETGSRASPVRYARVI